MIEKHYHLQVPRAEIEYIALLLESSDDDELEEKVTILVATHGKSTATSMVDVAQRLFSSNDTNIVAVDMPLEVRPQEILEKSRLTYDIKLYTPHNYSRVDSPVSYLGYGPYATDYLHFIRIKSKQCRGAFWCKF